MGNRGSYLCKVLQALDGVEVVLATDVNPVLARSFMKLNSLEVPIAASKEELLKEPSISAVVVATPDDCHLADACDAMKAGKAVFCEKPMATTIADCDSMLQVQKGTTSALHIGFNLRFHPMYSALKEIVGGGEIGRVTSVWVRHFVGRGGNYYFQDWHALKSKVTSLLLQKATHDFDLIHYISGSYTKRLTAIGNRSYYGGDKANDLTCPKCEERSDCVESSLDPQNPRNSCAFRSEVDIEDNEMVMMELDGGILANYAQCHFTPDYHRSYVFIGTKGRVESFEPQQRRGSYQSENRIEMLRRDGSPCRTYRFNSETAEGGHGGADPRMLAAWVKTLSRPSYDPANPIAGRQSVAVGCLAADSLRSDNGWRVVPALV